MEAGLECGLGEVSSTMEHNSQTPTAQLDWSLTVYCPKCDEDNDLASGKHDCCSDIAQAIFTNEWDKLKGWEVTCEHCGHEFKISEVIY